MLATIQSIWYAIFVNPYDRMLGSHLVFSTSNNFPIRYGTIRLVSFWIAWIPVPGEVQTVSSMKLKHDWSSEVMDMDLAWHSDDWWGRTSDGIRGELTFEIVNDFKNGIFSVSSHKQIGTIALEKLKKKSNLHLLSVVMIWLIQISVLMNWTT